MGKKISADVAVMPKEIVKYETSKVLKAAKETQAQQGVCVEKGGRDIDETFVNRRLTALLYTDTYNPTRASCCLSRRNLRFPHVPTV
jgi:hypothetical protein